MAIQIGSGVTIGSVTMTDQPLQAVAVGGNQGIFAYRWNPTTGFGAKYADPSTGVGSVAYGVAFHPAGNAVAVGTNGSPSVDVYAWNWASGFGAKYADPSVGPGSGAHQVIFSPSGKFIAVATTGSPYITVYNWDSVTGFGTRYSQSGVGGDSYSVAFNKAEDAIIVGSVVTGPQAYQWNSATGFGTKYASMANPGVGIYCYAVTFNSTGTAVFFGGGYSPYLQAYPWNSATGYGTLYSGVSNPSSSVYSIALNPAGTWVFASSNGAINARGWNDSTGWTGAGFSKTSAGGLGVSCAPTGDAVVAVGGLSPYIVAYPWNDSTGFGTPYSNPAVPPTGTCRAVAFSP